MMAQLLCHLWGDYILQSEWMAQNKTKRDWPAFVHAFVYSMLFWPLCLTPRHTVILGYVNVPLAVIMSTHFLIDRYRLARYVVWLKNWLAPYHGADYYEQRMSWNVCERTGYVPEDRGGPPNWMQVWLLIIADNTLHLTINYLALRYL